MQIKTTMKFHFTPVRMAIIKKSANNKSFPFVAQQFKNPTSIYEDVGLIPGLAQWVKDPVLLQPAA